MKESDTQKAILDYLALRHIFHYRNNSGAFVDSQKYFYRFGAVGSPDIVCVINGQYVGLEVKNSTGKQSPHQLQFHQSLEQAGGAYYVVRSLDDAIHAITQCTNRATLAA